MSALSYWKPGDNIVLREVLRGEVWSARPVIVVQDTLDLLVTYWPEGSPWMRSFRPGESGVNAHLQPESEDWELFEHTWIGRDALRLTPTGSGYSVLLAWIEAHTVFEGWYVNFEEPFRRTSTGFDYVDNILDIVAGPDMSDLRLVDRDELDEARDLSVISPDKATQITTQAADVIDLMQRRASIFGQGWENWSPDPGWPVPHLPDGWDVV